MTIMIIDHYAGSPNMGMEYRPYYLAKYWEKQGHKAVIVCASYSHLRQNNPKGKGKIWEERREGVTYVFIKTPAYVQNNLGRASNIFYFLKGLYQYGGRLARQYAPKVVVASSTYPFDLFPAAKIADRLGAKLVYEIHDLWPLSLTELHHFSKYSPIIWAVNKAQHVGVKRADLVASVIEQGDRYLAEQKLHPTRYQHIPNGVEISPTAPGTNSPCAQFIAKCKAQGRFVAMYLGGFAQGNYLEPLILGAASLKGSIEVVLVGDGMEKERMKAMAAKHHISNVHFFPSVPKNNVQCLLRQADCLYIGTSPSPLYRYGVAMNKLFDYMLAARPILFSTGAKNNPVAKAHCGIMVPPGNPQVVAKGLLQFCGMSQSQRDAIGKRGEEYCRRCHSYQAISQEFLSAISKL